ncbi:phytanoyl-CoA dioxygenase family protein [Candidatus Binatus sp.]|uniref:phytanoyl-CoA dioxygenase family protein n=1 Tax=Candidatus Binatus sp. TaxID=2811406 RepID=UPI003C450B63
MPSIPVVSAGDSPAKVVACLERDGAVVVSGVFDRSVRDSLLRELAPYLESVDPDASLNKKYAEDGGAADFYPGKTKRITALVARSETFRTFVTHPLMRSACDAILKPNCVHYQVHATAALKIGPGAREQVLHREEDPYQFFKVPRPRMIIASMWAITDFTEVNGGTKIVPGSHLWPADRVARPDEVVAAAMPAGSVLLWMGGTLHGAGANRTDEWRYGVFLSYSLGWLRQEENQYIDVPGEIARTLSKEVRELVGYRMHLGIGYADPTVRDSRGEKR